MDCSPTRLLCPWHFPGENTEVKWSEVTQSCPTLFNPMHYSLPGSSMGFSRREYWSWLPFPSPGDLPNLGIEPGSPTLQADSLPSEPIRKPTDSHRWTNLCLISYMLSVYSNYSMRCHWPRVENNSCWRSSSISSILSVCISISGHPGIYLSVRSEFQSSLC